MQSRLDEVSHAIPAWIEDKCYLTISQPQIKCIKWHKLLLSVVTICFLQLWIIISSREHYAHRRPLMLGWYENKQTSSALRPLMSLLSVRQIHEWHRKQATIHPHVWLEVYNSKFHSIGDKLQPVCFLWIGTFLFRWADLSWSISPTSSRPHLGPQEQPRTLGSSLWLSHVTCMYCVGVSVSSQKSDTGEVFFFFFVKLTKWN